MGKINHGYYFEVKDEMARDRVFVDFGSKRKTKVYTVPLVTREWKLGNKSEAECWESIRYFQPLKEGERNELL